MPQCSPCFPSGHDRQSAPKGPTSGALKPTRVLLVGVKRAWGTGRATAAIPVPRRFRSTARSHRRLFQYAILEPSPARPKPAVGSQWRLVAAVTAKEGALEPSSASRLSPLQRAVWHWTRVNAPCTLAVSEDGRVQSLVCRPDHPRNLKSLVYSPPLEQEIGRTQGSPLSSSQRHDGHRRLLLVYPHRGHHRRCQRPRLFHHRLDPRREHVSDRLRLWAVAIRSAVRDVRAQPHLPHHVSPLCRLQPRMRPFAQHCVAAGVSIPLRLLWLSDR